MKNALINIGLALVAFFITCLFGEWVLRSQNLYQLDQAGFTGIKFEWGKNFARRSTKDASLMVHIPFSSFNIPPRDKIVYRINSLGLRGPEVSKSKPEETFRILMIGDSVTFGLLVEEEDSFPRVLENRLEAKAFPSKVEVLNSGMSGAQIEQYNGYFEHYGREFSSDLVIINLVPFDCSQVTVLDSKHYDHFRLQFNNGRFLPSIIPAPPFLESFLLSNSNLYRGINQQLSKHLGYDLLIGKNVSLSTQTFCYEQLKELTAAIVQAGASYEIVLHPMLHGQSWVDRDGVHEANRRHYFLRKLAERFKTPLDIRAIYMSSESNPESLGYDIIHPTERAHQMIADAITDLVLEKYLDTGKVRK